MVAVVPLALAVLPMWKVQAVDASRCEGLPDEVTTSLQDLVGRPAIAVSPQWVRHQLEIWPAVSAVEVRLELPATLHVAAKATDAQGSVPVGRRWHAVTRTGSVGGALDHPLEPVLEGTACRPESIRTALSVARRIQAATAAHVELVREVTPADYLVRVSVSGGSRTVEMHVRPEATAGEVYWCHRIAADDAAASWVDLRWDDRLVLGGEG
jgi:hypothetical protein